MSGVSGTEEVDVPLEVVVPVETCFLSLNPIEVHHSGNILETPAGCGQTTV